MIPEKEHLKVLEDFAKNRTSIYRDAADTGTYITEADLARIRTAVKALKLFYGGRNWTCNGPTMNQAAVNNIMIPFEVEGNMARGVTVDVNVVERKRLTSHIAIPKRYVSIRIIPFYREVDEIPCLLNDK